MLSAPTELQVCSGEPVLVLLQTLFDKGERAVMFAHARPLGGRVFGSMLC